MSVLKVVSPSGYSSLGEPVGGHCIELVESELTKNIIHGACYPLAFYLVVSGVPTTSFLLCSLTTSGGPLEIADLWGCYSRRIRRPKYFLGLYSHLGLDTRLFSIGGKVYRFPRTNGKT